MNCKGVQAFARLSMLTLSMLPPLFRATCFRRARNRGPDPAHMKKA